MDRPLKEIKEDSFKEFYLRHSRSFWAYIFTVCRDKSLADDIFQDSFYKFLRANPLGLNEYQQKSYLYKIAFRLIVDRKRRIKVEKKVYGEKQAQIENMCREGQEHEILTSLDMGNTFKLLRPKERVLLWLAYVEGYSSNEIAGMTSAKENSVKVQIFRARKKFAAMLRRKEYE